MGKIGDLFVRLGLKSDDYKKGIEQAKRDTQNFGSSLKGMSSLAKTAWGAVAAAVVKFASDAIKMTQKWGDQFNEAVQGMKAGYGAFVRGLASGEGFKELFDNIRTAAKLAREAAAALDEVFERKTSYGYRAALVENEIAAQQLIMRDSSKSDKEREAAARRIIELEKQLGNEKKDVWNQEAKAQRDLFKAQTQMNDDEIDFMVKNYNQNRAIIQDSRAYLKEKERLEKSIRDNQAKAAWADDGISASPFETWAEQSRQQLAELEANTSQAIKDVAELTKKYDKSNDELVDNMAKAEIAVINIDTEVARAQARATSMLGTLTKAASTGGIDTQQSDPNLNKALGIQRAAADSFKSEAKLLREKYDSEKALLEQYHLDTTDLTKRYYTDLFNILDKEADKEIARLKNIEPVTIDPIDIDLSDVDADLDRLVDDFEEAQRRAEEAINGFANAVTNGFADSCDLLMESLMGLRDFNGGEVVQALLAPLADLAVQAGSIIMAEGIATLAAKSALETFGATGWGAVAAGAALIAAGAAAKAGLSALAAKASGGATAASSGSSSSSRPQDIKSEMTVYVSGRISGSDIIISGQRTTESWAR